MLRSLCLVTTNLLLLLAFVKAESELPNPFVPCSANDENGVDCSDIGQDGNALGTFDQFRRRAAIRRPGIKGKFQLQSDVSMNELKTLMKNQVTAGENKRQKVDTKTLATYALSVTDGIAELLETLKSSPDVPDTATVLLEQQLEEGKNIVARQYPSPELLPIKPWWFILLPTRPPTTEEIYTSLFLNYIGVLSFLYQIIVGTGLDVSSASLIELLVTYLSTILTFT